MGNPLSNLSFECSKIFEKYYYISLGSKHVRCFFACVTFFLAFLLKYIPHI